MSLVTIWRCRGGVEDSGGVYNSADIEVSNGVNNGCGVEACIVIICDKPPGGIAESACLFWPLAISISISIVELQFGAREELGITRAGFSMPC